MFGYTLIALARNFGFGHSPFSQRLLRSAAIGFFCWFMVERGLGAADRAMAAEIVQGERFLAGLFNAKLGLLPEYEGAEVYWLYHDNYLAAKILKTSHRDLAKRIEAAIHGFGVWRSGKIEIVFDEAPDGFPFRSYELTEVTNVAGKSIRTERVTTNILKGWEAYADLLLMASIAKAKAEPDEANGYFQKALLLWDGHGFSDPASSKSGLYATYKLALGLLAADRVKQKLPFRAVVLEQLRKLQSPTGGWITDYNRDGQPRGLANVETTCLVLLALRLEAETRH